VFSPPETGVGLPYLDGTVDIVVVGPCSAAEIDEATRVASVAVVHRPADTGVLRCRVTWKAGVADTGPTVSIVAAAPSTGGRSVDAIIRSLPAPFAGEILVPGYDVGNRPLDAQLQVRRVPPEATPVKWAQAAAARAESDIVVFVDPSLVPIRGWLDALVANLGKTAVVGATSGVVLTPSPDGLGVANPVAPTSGILAVRRDRLLGVGGLPAAAGVAEACAVLAETLQRAGHKVITEPEALAVRADTIENR
jgi:hypothetical protein